MGTKWKIKREREFYKLGKYIPKTAKTNQSRDTPAYFNTTYINIALKLGQNISKVAKTDRSQDTHI